MWGGKLKPREVKRLAPGHTAHPGSKGWTPTPRAVAKRRQTEVRKGCRWRPNPGAWPLACGTQTFPDACSLPRGVAGRVVACMVIVTAHMSACFLCL